MTKLTATPEWGTLNRQDIRSLRSQGYCCYPAADQQEVNSNKGNLAYVTTMRRGHEIKDEVWIIWKSKTITTP